MVIEKADSVGKKNNINELLCIFTCFWVFRFWASVEPYCADITNEEIRLLEELLKPPEDEAEYYKV